MRSKQVKWSSFGAIIATIMLVITAVAPGVAQAQGPSLSVIAATDDGNLSVRMPDGWYFFDNTGDPVLPGFSSMLFFGENQHEAETRLSDFRGEGSNILGLGGAIVLVDTPFFQQQGLEPTAELFMELLAGELDIPAEDQREVTLGDNPGYAAYVDTAESNNEVGFLITLDTPIGVVVATVTSTPAMADANTDLLVEIANSISAPGERSGQGPGLGGGGQDTPSVADRPVFAAEDGTVSVRLPANWVTEDHISTDFVFFFGESQAALQSRVNDFFADTDVPAVGNGGLVMVLPMDEMGIPDPPPEGLERTILESLAADLGPEITLISEYFDLEMADGASFVLYSDANTGEVGLSAIILFGEPRQVALVLISADNEATFAENAEFFGEILGTVRVPAEAPGAAPPGGGQGPGLGGGQGDQGGGLPGLPGSGQGNEGGGLPGLPGTGSQPGVDLPKRVNSPDGSFGFGLPGTWIDPIEIESVFYFGVTPNDASAFEAGTAQTGAAGAYLVVPRATLDPGGTMSAEQLFGTIFADAAFTIVSVQGGQLDAYTSAYWAEATLDGLHGYWVVYDLGPSVAVMIVATPEANWAKDQIVLEAIFRSGTIPG